MKTKTSAIWTIMHVLAWIVFVGLSIKAGSVLTSGVVSLFVSPETVKKVYMGMDLSGLYFYDRVWYIIIWGLITFIAILKALMFYQVIRIFLKINFDRPFSEDVSSLISLIGYIALGVGVITILVAGNCEWLAKRGVEFPNMDAYLGSGREYLLLGGVIYMISKVFKRGIEIQSENELTV